MNGVPKVLLPTLMTLMLRSTGWHRKAKRNLYPFRVCFNQDLAIFLVPSQPYHSGFFSGLMYIKGFSNFPIQKRCLRKQMDGKLIYSCKIVQDTGQDQTFFHRAATPLLKGAGQISKYFLYPFTASFLSQKCQFQASRFQSSYRMSSKGQLILKCIFCFLNYEQKISAPVGQGKNQNFQVRFKEELITPKRHFEIN